MVQVASHIRAERWVLFDAVATLIEPRPCVVQVYLDAGAKWGWSGGADVLRNRFQLAVKQCFPLGEPTSEAAERDRWRQTVQSVFRELPPAESAAVFEELWSHFAATSAWRVFADVLPCWKTLAMDGYRIAIASNFDARLRQIATGLSPLNQADRIFISTELGWSKPDVRFYQSIRRELPCDQIWMVGDDRQNDVVAAENAGLQAIWLCRGGASAGSLLSLTDLPSRIGIRSRPGE
jgi:putative hydrolase of the HAD superfamily